MDHQKKRNYRGKEGRERERERERKRKRKRRKGKEEKKKKKVNGIEKGKREMESKISLIPCEIFAVGHRAGEEEGLARSGGGGFRWHHSRTG